MLSLCTHQSRISSTSWWDMRPCLRIRSLLISLRRSDWPLSVQARLNLDDSLPSIGSQLSLECASRMGSTRPTAPVFFPVSVSSPIVWRMSLSWSLWTRTKSHKTTWRSLLAQCSQFTSLRTHLLRRRNRLLTIATTSLNPSPLPTTSQIILSLSIARFKLAWRCSDADHPLSNLRHRVWSIFVLALDDCTILV